METPIEPPTKPGFASLTWVPDSAVAKSVSPFSFSEQAYAWPGQRWRIVAKLPSMKPEDGLAWMAFFLDLNGMGGTFWVRETSFLRTKALECGLPELDGPHASGRAVRTRGWTPNMQVLIKGQLFSVGGRVRRALGDVFSLPDGTAEIACWPFCRDLADSQPLEWKEPKGAFRMDEVPGFVFDENRLTAGFQFSASEAILP